MYNHSPHHQQGLSLVEILIALTLSVVLLLGLGEILISNKDSYRFQQSQSFVQENARYSMLFVEKWVQKAGYRGSAAHRWAEVYPAVAAANNCSAFDAEQVITSTTDGNTGFCIRYQVATASEPNCVGNTVNQDQVIVTRIFQSGNALQCSAPNSAGVWQTATLIDNVETFTIRFGLDLNKDRAVDQYLATINADQWDEIFALRLSTTHVANERTFSTGQTVLDDLADGNETDFNDPFLRRTATRTVALRNLAL